MLVSCQTGTSTTAFPRHSWEPATEHYLALIMFLCYQPLLHLTEPQLSVDYGIRDGYHRPVYHTYCFAFLSCDDPLQVPCQQAHHVQKGSTDSPWKIITRRKRTLKSWSGQKKSCGCSQFSRKRVASSLFFIFIFKYFNKKRCGKHIGEKCYEVPHQAMVEGASLPLYFCFGLKMI